VIVKRKQFILLRLVRLELLLKRNWITAHYKVLGAAVVTSIVLWHELLDSDSVSFVDDIIFVVSS